MILLEVYELAVNNKHGRAIDILSTLKSLRESNPAIDHLIDDGIVVVEAATSTV